MTLIQQLTVLLLMHTRGQATQVVTAKTDQDTQETTAWAEAEHQGTTRQSDEAAMKQLTVLILLAQNTTPTEPTQVTTSIHC